MSENEIDIDIDELLRNVAQSNHAQGILDYILAAKNTKDPDFQSKMVEKCNTMLECLEVPLAEARISGYVV